MYSISGTNISLTRGDSLKLKINIFSNEQEYHPKAGDKIRFAMKQNYKAHSCVIQKEIPINTLLLTLNPSDTKKLLFGEYVYDIQLTYANGDVDTFIKGKFILTEEVI